MTAAIHDQARKAANLAPVNVTPEDTARIADATSAVWEPVVLSLVEALECSADGHGEDHARLVTEVKRLLQDGSSRVGD